MKVCSKCKRELVETEFNKRRNGLQPWCRDCNKAQHRAHYAQNKERYKQQALDAKWQLRANALRYVMEYVSARGGCCECGESDFRCIHFNHLDPATKQYNISNMISGGYSIAKIQQELDKCNILCANCHSKHTAQQYSWYDKLVPYM